MHRSFTATVLLSTLLLNACLFETEKPIFRAAESVAMPALPGQWTLGRGSEGGKAAVEQRPDKQYRIVWDNGSKRHDLLGRLIPLGDQFYLLEVVGFDSGGQLHLIKISLNTVEVHEVKGGVPTIHLLAKRRKVPVSAYTDRGLTLAAAAASQSKNVIALFRDFISAGTTTQESSTFFRDVPRKSYEEEFGPMRDGARQTREKLEREIKQLEQERRRQRGY